MNTTDIKVKLTLIESMLGSQPANKEIADEFIASKAPNAKSREEEIESLGVDAVIEKGMTIFSKEDGKPFIWDYQIKGMFKDACGCLSRVKGNTLSSALKAYKKVIDGLIFIDERKIFIELSGPMSVCQRPLRAMTMQGERVALASSEEIPEGSSIIFTIKLLDEALKDVVLEWLDYGALRGLGQWRNSGHGRFTYEIIS